LRGSIPENLGAIGCNKRAGIRHSKEKGRDGCGLF